DLAVPPVNRKFALPVVSENVPSDSGFDCSGCSQGVTGYGLGRAGPHGTAKYRVDGAVLHCIILQCGGAMHVYVVYCFCVNARFVKGLAHGRDGARAIRMGAGNMVGVLAFPPAGQSDGAGLTAKQEKRTPFTQIDAASIYRRWVAGCCCDGFQGVEAGNREGTKCVDATGNYGVDQAGG